LEDPPTENIAPKPVVEKVPVEEEVEQKVLDMSNLIRLKDKPQTYIANEVYVPFEFVLDKKFVKEATPYVASVEAWYDEFNIEGI
jgi:hypothetical protein